jgi:hypothetical protein
VLLAALVYLAIMVTGVILVLRDDGLVGSPLLLVGTIGLVVFNRWYGRQYSR